MLSTCFSTCCIDRSIYVRSQASAVLIKIFTYAHVALTGNVWVKILTYVWIKILTCVAKAPFVWTNVFTYVTRECKRTAWIMVFTYETKARTVWIKNICVRNQSTYVHCLNNTILIKMLTYKAQADLLKSLQYRIRLLLLVMEMVLLHRSLPVLSGRSPPSWNVQTFRIIVIFDNYCTSNTIPTYRFFCKYKSINIIPFFLSLQV